MKGVLNTLLPKRSVCRSAARLFVSLPLLRLLEETPARLVDTGSG
jgi:hypothetical protein